MAYTFQGRSRLGEDTRGGRILISVDVYFFAMRRKCGKRGEHQPVGVYLVFMTLFLLFVCAWKYQRNAEIGCFNFIYVLVLLGFELKVLYWLNICTTIGIVIPLTSCFYFLF